MLPPSKVSPRVTAASHGDVPAHSTSFERTVLITGAAGAIGSATASRFLELGMTVLGLDRSPRPGSISHAQYRHVTVDLTDSRAAEVEIDGALRGLPPLAHVVGIAGGALPFEPRTQDEPQEITSDLFQQSLEANLTTQFTVLRVSLRYLTATDERNRSVTLTSSFNALSAQGMPAYSAAKAGIIGMMYGLVKPLGVKGIRVNVVAPGTVRTPRTERLWSAESGHFERLERGAALRRLASPADIAEAFTSVALMLRHMTGQVLVIDGGQTVVHL